MQTNRCDFCPANQYADTVSKSCKECSTAINNCSTCTNSTWCTFCQTNFYLYQGRCITAAICLNISGYYLNTQQSACVQCISPCQTCTSQISCTSCLTGFLIPSNNTCSNSCPFSSYADSHTKSCQPCNSSVCRTCTSTPNTCLDCYPLNSSSRPTSNLNNSILFNRTCINSSSCPN